MAERIGECKDCGRKYKIPSTFQGTRAKCKKCGGAVEIPAPEAAGAAPKKSAESKAESQAPAPKPETKQAPSKRDGMPVPKGEPAPSVKRSSISERMAKGGKKSSGGRSRRGGSKDAGKSKNKLWLIVGAAAVVIVAVVLILVLSGGEDEATPVKPAVADQVVREAEDTPVKLEAEKKVELPKKEEEPEKAAEAKVAKVEVPSDPEKIDPKIEFDLFPPIIGCSQERFDELTEAFKQGYLKSDLPAFRRGKYKDTFDEAVAGSYDVIPVIINAFNGLDLLSRDDVAIGSLIAKTWNGFTGKGFVNLTFKGDIDEEAMQKNLRSNYITIHSLVNLWRDKYADDEEAQKVFFANVEKARGGSSE